MISTNNEIVVKRILNYLRLPGAAFFAMIVTAFLFYLMQSLIASGEKAITGENLGNIVEFTRIKKEQIVERKKRRPEPPPMPDEPPKVAKPRLQSNIETNAWSNEFKPLDTSVAVSSSLNFRSDGEYLPILKVQPVYPTRALERGLIGWVVVEFTVDEIGKVVDPVVIDHCVEVWRASRDTCFDNPGKIFDRPALAAAARFKYKPKIIDGQAIATAGVRNMISFALDE